MNYGNIYTGEISQAQLDALTKATLEDFQAGLVYSEAERVANVSSGTNNETQTPMFVLRRHVVDANDLTRESMRFQNAVRAGNAYKVDPTTTTTTAPTTTT